MELDVPDSLLDELGPTGNGSGDLLPEGLNGVWSKLISKNFLVKKMIQLLSTGNDKLLPTGNEGNCSVVLWASPAA